jgi:hypothetical protein
MLSHGYPLIVLNYILRGIKISDKNLWNEKNKEYLIKKGEIIKLTILDKKIKKIEKIVL